MSVLFGKQLPDGSIQYIKSDEWGNLHNIVRNLVFYPTEVRVDKLLALGDLEWLGKSPNYPNKMDNDTMNCYAKKRDGNQRSKRLEARIADDLEEYLLFNERLSFLFRNGEWFVYANDKCENIKDVTMGIFDNPQSMKEYTIKQNTEEKFVTREFASWRDMLTAAQEENIALFVFTGGYTNKRLLTTINQHLLLQK